MKKCHLCNQKATERLGDKYLCEMHYHEIGVMLYEYYQINQKITA